MRVSVGDRLQDTSKVAWHVIDVWTGGATIKTLDDEVQLLSHHELSNFTKGR